MLAAIVLLIRNYIIDHIFTPRRKKDKKLPNTNYEEIEFESGIGKVRGWVIHSGEARGCFLLVHGWGSNKSDMLRYVDTLVTRGYDVVLIDVAGHGESERIQKQVSIESFVQSITSSIDYVLRRPDIASHSIYLLGHSMGGVAASIVNSTDLRIQAIITDSMPTSLKSIAASMAEKVKIPYFPFGWLLVSWFLLRGDVFLKARREWELETVLNNHKSPALAFHSTEDKKVSASNVNVLLKHSNFKRVVTVSTSGHHNCVKDECFWEKVFHFIENNKGENRDGSY